VAQYDIGLGVRDGVLRLIYGKGRTSGRPGEGPDFRTSARPSVAAEHTHRGKHYGISLQWGPNTLMYNTKKGAPAPTFVGVDLTTRSTKGKSPFRTIRSRSRCGAVLDKTQPRSASRIRRLELGPVHGAAHLLKKQNRSSRSTGRRPAKRSRCSRNGDAVIGASCRTDETR